MPAFRPKIDRTTAANAVSGVTAARDAGATAGADDETDDADASDNADEPLPVGATSGPEPITGRVDDEISGVEPVPDDPGAPAFAVVDNDCVVVGAVTGECDADPPPDTDEPPETGPGGVEVAEVPGVEVPVELDVDPEPVDVGVDPSDDSVPGAGVVVDGGVVEPMPTPEPLDVVGDVVVPPVVDVDELPGVPASVPDAEPDPADGPDSLDGEAADTVRVVADESSDELLPLDDAPPPVAVSAFATPDPLMSAAPRPTVNALVFTHVGTS